MLKNNIFKTMGMSLLAMSLIGSSVFADTTDFGAAGASNDTTYTLEEMLEYAIEDEYLAYAEYELIIEELNASRPFTNIIKAEKAHIEIVETLFKAYDLPLPEIDASSYIILPDSINDALEEGVKAEIANIAMYEAFLKEDLPEDIKLAFENLKRASEFHLAAFEGNNGQKGRNISTTEENTNTSSNNSRQMRKGFGKNRQQ